ncbi:CRISPR-associated protein [Campylobacter sp. RM9344]|uniref:CRISPR-associated protein n=1 Tax=Campylobacter californiensis TaxID=1032243 RepID=A0AAW3ZY71_9BACT|nr:MULTISPECIES: TM1802 family CRISPR-associated protein [unclassified Campylobacter]MBE2985011.1 CRISPR-associated protein [Campylobacter sp. RM6883]MBE2995207.1 CRISPR-associated protein [Campylobacter sp. RM6913]MBE3029536.1 CRISPR-associated protein [Campylobacter sp. RM9344]MBE3608200.1 CRISPR-associated protein [Campylobacter sp. RM9337]QCD51630.1 CRISPR/Cas system-associated protein Cas8, type I-B/HMARI [Campylobacter sp. RM6914]
MGDIIKIFSDIGSVYEEDEKRIKNRAYEYDEIKCYLCDIDTKNIIPSTNIPKDELIITRFGIGANSGNLFPNYQFISKDVSKDEAKFIKGVLKSVKNLMSYFSPSDIENNEILKRSSELNEGFFDDIITNIKALDEHKAKDKKVATFFCLSYNEKPISSYFKEIFDKHIDKKEVSKIYGYDILTNKKGVGADANLAFCSVNELPENLKSVKSKFLPLNESSANRIRIGFLATDKELSHNFYGVKMAILPTLLSNDQSLFKEIIQILKEAKKNDVEELAQAEEIAIDVALEYVAKREKDLPVLNTILFYAKNNAAIDVLLQIDDVLPSYISKISNAMGSRNIKAFKRKDIKDNDEAIYLQNLFENSLEIMKFLLSQNKVDLDTMIQRYAELIYYGNINKKYRFAIDWGKYFNGYYPQRSIESISKYQELFNEIDILNKKLTLQKECDLQNLKDKKELIRSLIQGSEFINNDSVLQGAYLLGMLSSALMKWQYAVSESASFARWLNNNGAITKDSLERIWTKCYATKGKLENISKHPNLSINQTMELAEEILPGVFLSKDVVKSSHITLAFAMGGNDYNKFIKDEKKGE